MQQVPVPSDKTKVCTGCAAVTDQVDAVQWDETRDTVAQHFLGLTAADFVERYTSGAFAEDTPGLMAVLSLFPELD